MLTAELLRAQEQGTNVAGWRFHFLQNKRNRVVDLRSSQLSFLCCVGSVDSLPCSSGNRTFNHIIIMWSGNTRLNTGQRLTMISNILCDQYSQSDLSSRTGSGRLDVSHDSSQILQMGGGGRGGVRFQRGRSEVRGSLTRNSQWFPVVDFNIFNLSNNTLNTGQFLIITANRWFSINCCLI